MIWQGLSPLKEEMRICFCILQKKIPQKLVNPFSFDVYHRSWMQEGWENNSSKHTTKVSKGKELGFSRKYLEEKYVSYSNWLKLQNSQEKNDIFAIYSSINISQNNVIKFQWLMISVHRNIISSSNKTKQNFCLGASELHALLGIGILSHYLSSIHQPSW